MKCNKSQLIIYTYLKSTMTQQTLKGVNVINSLQPCLYVYVLCLHHEFGISPKTVRAESITN